MDTISLAISDLVESLKVANHQDELAANLESWKMTTGFDWYLFALNRSESMQVSEHVIITNYPSAWMEKYESEKLFLVDPVVKYVMHHQNAIFWDSFTSMEGYNSSEQKEFISLAANFGLMSGCSIPCNSYGNYAVFSMANKSCENKIKLNEYLPYNHYYGNQLLESILRIDSNANNKALSGVLSEREVECLFWGSEGKTAWEISKILGISERTVVFHFTNAADKLDASNRQHAISKALLHGILKPSI